jgi:hypothetical protein
VGGSTSDGGGCSSGCHKHDRATCGRCYHYNLGMRLSQVARTRDQPLERTLSWLRGCRPRGQSVGSRHARSRCT